MSVSWMDAVKIPCYRGNPLIFRENPPPPPGLRPCGVFLRLILNRLYGTVALIMDEGLYIWRPAGRYNVSQRLKILEVLQFSLADHFGDDSCSVVLFGLCEYMSHTHSNKTDHLEDFQYVRQVFYPPVKHPKICVYLRQ